VKLREGLLPFSLLFLKCGNEYKVFEALFEFFICRGAQMKKRVPKA